jgi:hypothetical protein
MKTRKRFAALAVATALVVGGAVTLMATAGPAYAQTTELCSGSGGYSDQCLNAWNGGPLVVVWHGGVTNDTYEYLQIDRCDPQGTSTANCPIPGNPIGKWVVQIYDPRSGLCIGDFGNDPTNPTAGEVGCNTISSGYGGGYGTVFVLVGSSYGCYNGSLHYISAHWSTNWTNRVGINWQTGYGGLVYFNSYAFCLYEDSF